MKSFVCLCQILACFLLISSLNAATSPPAASPSTGTDASSSYSAYIPGGGSGFGPGGSGFGQSAGGVSPGAGGSSPGTGGAGGAGSFGFANKDLAKLCDQLFGPAEDVNNTTQVDYPSQNLTLFLADIHIYSGNISYQFIAYHYCTVMNKGLMQCVLYNGNKSTSTIVGVEYFISKELFEGLSTDEKKLWHSHHYEVLSGMFVAPDVEAEDEPLLMEWLMTTYGKVVDTWHQEDRLPIGAPRLGMTLALDSQVDWSVVQRLDRELGLETNYKQRRQARKTLIVPELAEGADEYLDTGKMAQFKTFYISVPNHGKTRDD